MPRASGNRTRHKPLAADAATVFVDEIVILSPPNTRGKTARAAESKPVKSRRDKANDAILHDDSQARDGTGASTNGRAKTTRTTRSAKRREHEDATSEVSDASDASRASSASSASRPAARAATRWPLPGTLSPVAGTARRLRVIALLSAAPTVLVAAVLAVLRVFAVSLPPLWTYSTVTTPNAAFALAALCVRILKLVLSWGSLPHLAALDVLAGGPIIYLLSMHYQLPLTTVLLSESLNVAADILPVIAWRRLSAKRTSDPKGDAGARSLMSTADDLLTFVYSSIFAGVLYSFTFAQACRFFLPYVLVVHFEGIETVTPARAHDLDRSASLTVSGVLLAIFQSVPAALLSLACGIAARIAIFRQGLTYNNDAARTKAVGLRMVSLSLIVGLDIIQRCRLGINGVDPIGAMAFASIWQMAPLLVGIGLGCAGVE